MREDYKTHLPQKVQFLHSNQKIFLIVLLIVLKYCAESRTTVGLCPLTINCELLILDLHFRNDFNTPRCG